MDIRQKKNSHQTVFRYAVTLSAVLAAAGFFFASMRLCAFALMAVAVVFFLSSWYWISMIEEARREKCLLDEKLLQSQKMASIGELSAGIAHEINNPLAIIGQEVEWMRHLLRSAPGIPPDIEDGMREISQQVERCKEIIQKLLSFARKMEPVLQGIDINKLIEDMAKLVEIEAKLNNIKIVRDYRKNLPLVHTDPPLMRQVVLNLLNNAVQAVEKDGTITISTSMKEDCVEIVVSDTGCGIEECNLGKIFDPFYTTKPPGRGTGLGLAICHGIIERLGGHVSAAGAPGKGASFTVVLPVKESRQASTR